MSKAIALYTGGKDSHYAILKAEEEGYEIPIIVIVYPKNPESWMFHTVNIKWTRLHVEAMNKKPVIIHTSGIKEKEVEELLVELIKLKEKEEFNTIVTGAVASKYQKKRIDYIANKLGIKHYAPLWGSNPEELLLKEAETLDFIITAVQAYGLTEKWLGVKLAKDNIEEFLRICRKYQISPVGEGGEFETFVVDSPLMSKRIRIRKAQKIWYPQGYGYYIIEDAVLEPKGQHP